MPERNLVLIHRGLDYAQDFAEIAARITALDPGIAVFCTAPGTVQVMTAAEWERPTLTVALLSNFRGEIRRGPVLTNRKVHKPGQHRAFIEAGIPSPAAQRFVPGMALDPILFGELVVLKPINPDFASYGRGIQLYRRRRLETMRLADFPRAHLIHRDPDGYMVQRFIDTGPFLPVYRALTLFGAVLYCWLAREQLPLPPRGSSDAEIEACRITSNTGDFRMREACFDPAVIELGARAASAFPDIPLLGTDIIREERTGRLYVLECNPGGNTWHFSSAATAAIRQQMGGASRVGARTAERLGRQMLIDQFGAWDRAAAVLAEKTRQLAA